MAREHLKLTLLHMLEDGNVAQIRKPVAESVKEWQKLKES